jgi:serine/threonine protein kinase
VLDFGLVKTQHEGPRRGALDSRADTLKGTPAYMSPEQITNSRRPGPASDIYSLGCVAYWLLTGRVPFAEKTLLATLARHVTSPPPLPSAAAPVPVPASLDAIVVDCLAKEPADRPESMQILYERLRLLALEYPWDQERAVEWWTQHAPEVVSRRTFDPASTTVRELRARTAPRAGG